MSMSEPALPQTSGPCGIFEKAPVNAPCSAHPQTHARQHNRPSRTPGSQARLLTDFCQKQSGPGNPEAARLVYT